MRLTKREKELLLSAAEFVLAGEWPWEGDGSKRAIRKEERDAATLQSASAKLNASLSSHKRGET